MKGPSLSLALECVNLKKMSIHRSNKRSRLIRLSFQRKDGLVDRAGFEPAASALRTRRSYRADLPAQNGAFGKNRLRANLEVSVNVLVAEKSREKKLIMLLNFSAVNFNKNFALNVKLIFWKIIDVVSLVDCTIAKFWL